MAMRNSPRSKTQLNATVTIAVVLTSSSVWLANKLGAHHICAGAPAAVGLSVTAASTAADGQRARLDFRSVSLVTTSASVSISRTAVQRALSRQAHRSGGRCAARVERQTRRRAADALRHWRRRLAANVVLLTMQGVSGKPIARWHLIVWHQRNVVAGAVEPARPCQFHWRLDCCRSGVVDNFLAAQHHGDM